MFNRRAVTAAILAVGLAFAVGASADDSESAARQFAVGKLRQYCAACHGLGSDNFFPTLPGGDEALWGYWANTAIPEGGKRWAQRMIEVLDWPGGAMPPIDQTTTYMPMGFKREELAADVQNGTPVRALLLNALRGALLEENDLAGGE